VLKRQLERTSFSILRILQNKYIAFLIPRTSVILFSSDIGNDIVMIIVKFVIIVELMRSQNSMAVIFLSSGVSHIQFVNSENYNQNDIILRTTALFFTR